MTNNGNQKIQIYGKYSLGSGSILKNSKNLFNKIDDPEVIESYKNSIIRDMKKAGIPLGALKKYHILDVGTGRQAIAFHRLGAKKISHFDISKENVRRMKSFIKENNLENSISTKCVDLMQYVLSKEKYDLVFLHGLVQHFSDVHTGLKNCLSSVKKNGYVSLYFSRSGTFFNFVMYMIRDLLKENSDYKEYFVNSIFLNSDNCMLDYFTSGLMDAFFVEYINLFNCQDYIDFLGSNGFEVVSSSKLDPYGKKIDHTFGYPGVVLTGKKTLPEGKCDNNLLRKSINQLDPNIYGEDDKVILKTIQTFNLLKEKLLAKKIPKSIIMSLTFMIFKWLLKLDHSLSYVADYQDGEIRHSQLQSILNNALKIIDEEF